MPPSVSYPVSPINSKGLFPKQAATFSIREETNSKICSVPKTKLAPLRANARASINSTANAAPTPSMSEKLADLSKPEPKSIKEPPKRKIGHTLVLHSTKKTARNRWIGHLRSSPALPSKIRNNLNTISASRKPSGFAAYNVAQEKASTKTTAPMSKLTFGHLFSARCDTVWGRGPGIYPFLICLFSLAYPLLPLLPPLASLSLSLSFFPLKPSFLSLPSHH